MRICCDPLLAGAGESGKSTFIKQMRIIHGKGYSKDELLAFRQLIHNNIVSAMQSLFEGTQQLNIPLSQEMKVRTDEWAHRGSSRRTALHTLSLDI